MATTSPQMARRRQRSTRVLTAIIVLIVATAGVAAAVPTRSPLWLTIAGVAAVVLAWAAVRITWTEVVQTRREAAADRTTTASAYRDLFEQRSKENTEFATTMTQRLHTNRTVIDELRGSLAGRTADLATARGRIRALEQQVATLRDETHVLTVTITDRDLELARVRAELATAHAEWERLQDADPAADLASWDAHASQIAAEHAALEGAIGDASRTA